MRLVFAGTPDVALPSLARLADSAHEVACVVTRPDAPKGRGRAVEAAPVARFARELGLPLLQPSSLATPEFAAALTDLAPDCCPVVAYGGLVPPDLLMVPRFGWVNLHFSLLPAWRGAAPVQHAVLHGDAITGATTFLLERGLDTGPLFGTVTEEIGDRDTSGEVLERLSRSGAELLLQTLDGIEAGRLGPTPQSGDGVSEAPKLTPRDAQVVWSQPALRVDRLVRACTPAPGAWTTFREARLKLSPLELVPTEADLAPGQLLVDKRQVLVGTGSHAVRLTEVQPVGRRSMLAADWARGISDPSVDSFT